MNAKLSYLGVATGLVVFGIMLVPVRAAEPDELTRAIGLEMLRQRMIEQRVEQARSIDWTPPGYFMVGYPVRIG